MIISNIIGGLGNQMFQFAAARALAMRKNVPLKLDVSDFATYGLHQGFELGSVFNIAIDLAGSQDVRKILGWQSSPRIRRFLLRRRFAVLRSSKLVIEPGFGYWNGFHNLPGDCYLSGYWQSEKYFHDAAVLLRRDFTFRQPFDNTNAECSSLISEVNSVSVHVRRGNYANDAFTSATHGMCSIEYYRQALQLVGQRVPNAQFFVFSDDICWVKKNLPLDPPFHYVDFNHGSQSFNDMRLMSMCKHNIIANSTFSWWAAWLNPGVDKIVVAPRRWFNIEHHDTRDIYCSNWVVL